jgi:hypothetical protein
MQSRFLRAALAAVCLSAVMACSRSKDTAVLGTFQLGDRVQAGPLLYQASETEWKTDLGPTRLPSNRFLLIKVGIYNRSEERVSVPGFELRASDGKTYPEVMERLENVPTWLGMLRSVDAGKSVEGHAVFDVPVGAYTLAVSDAGEVGNEKHALIKIPVEIHDSQP